VQAFYFTAQMLRAAVVNNNVVSYCQALLTTGLGCEYGRDLAFRQPVPGSNALQLPFPGGVDDQYAVQRVIAGSFGQ